MTIETDRDKLRVVSLTKFNHVFSGFCLEPVEERRRRLTKRPTQGKLGAVFLDGPFFMLSFFLLFLHHPSANFAIAQRFAGSISLQQLVT